MTYLFNRNFTVDTAGDLILNTSTGLGDNSNDVATTAYVQGVLAAQGYNPSNVNITGGTINGTSIGATTPSTGNFTTGNFSSAVTATSATINGTLTLTGALVFASSRVITVAGNVTVGATDTVIVMRKSTPAITTITLPTSPTPPTGRYLIIKDGSGNAASFNITVSGNIDGGTSSVININYGSLAVIYNGSTWSAIT